MSTLDEPFVVDASIAVKWVATEAGSDEAVALYNRSSLAAPELLLAESANALWKKVQLGDLNREEAVLGAQALARADVELFSHREVIEQAETLALAYMHPTYDCLYLALTLKMGRRFVTADERFVKKIRQNASNEIRDSVVSLSRVQEILN